MSEPLLLDTHVLIWTLIDDRDKLSDAARKAISRSVKALSVSVVSVWEIVLKHLPSPVATPASATAVSPEPVADRSPVRQ